MSDAQDALPQHRDALFRFAMLQLRDAAHAEDCVQETLLAALQSARPFAGASSLKTWLTGILKHKIADHFRAAARDDWLDDAALENDDEQNLDYGGGALAVFNAGGDPPEEQLNPEALFLRSRLADQLVEGLDALPAATARVFVMREMIGADTAEVCVELAITANYCGVLHHRARSALRVHLEQQGWCSG